MFLQKVARLQQAVQAAPSISLLDFEAHSGDEAEYKNDAAGYEEDGSLFFTFLSCLCLFP